MHMFIFIDIVRLALVDSKRGIHTYIYGSKPIEYSDRPRDMFEWHKRTHCCRARKEDREVSIVVSLPEDWLAFFDFCETLFLVADCSPATE